MKNDRLLIVFLATLFDIDSKYACVKYRYWEEFESDKVNRP